ncbi:MAG: hypothetical protein EXS13_13480 [Planctomycetes bacterium]|nr:hypothetical protein [Planctomycetota bacterium]
MTHTAEAVWRGEDLTPRLRALLDGTTLPEPPQVIARSDAEFARGAFLLRPLDAKGFARLLVRAPEAQFHASLQAGLDRLFGQRADPSVEAWRARLAAEFGTAPALKSLRTCAGSSAVARRR